MAISLLAGFTVGLSPSASAHKDTGSVAVVTGEVVWPGPADGADDKAFFDLEPSPIFGDMGWRDTSDLSILDLRHGTSAPLNGCRLKDGNSQAGLPVGTLGGPKDDPPELSVPPTPEELSDLAAWLESGEENLPRTYNNSDLCFRFTDVEINAAGVYEGRHHATSFECVASGTSGATGAGAEEIEPGVPSPLPTFGAFYGEFVCDGAPAAVPPLGFIPSADGHFHGLTVASTTIAFLGTVHCTVPPFDPMDPDNPDNCPKTADNDPGSKDDTHVNPDPVNESRIKHTLACKGEVLPVPLPDEPKNPSFLDRTVDPAISNSISTATVVLECVIA